ncbi:hypothetical protein [Amycolatopsis sp. cmx-8-4]|uniref:hypothetical protein n=1 Tax=Amycolatopsis sp. cmx-8-4 TaxID=2790947 RepID=UPI00397E057E
MNSTFVNRTVPLSPLRPAFHPDVITAPAVTRTVVTKPPVHWFTEVVAVPESVRVGVVQSRQPARFPAFRLEIFADGERVVGDDGGTGAQPAPSSSTAAAAPDTVEKGRNTKLSKARALSKVSFSRI